MMIIAMKPDTSAIWLRGAKRSWRGYLGAFAIGGGQGERVAGHGRPRRRLSRAARSGAQDLRALPRRVLAQIGGGTGLPDRVHHRADSKRVSRLTDSRGIWRLGTAAEGRRRDPRGD